MCFTVISGGLWSVLYVFIETIPCTRAPSCFILLSFSFLDCLYISWYSLPPPYTRSTHFPTHLFFLWFHYVPFLVKPFKQVSFCFNIVRAKLTDTCLLRHSRGSTVCWTLERRPMTCCKRHEHGTSFGLLISTSYW